MKLFIIIIGITGLFVISCKKEIFISSRDAKLNTSVDSLHFDTVFTSTGSVTHFFRIYNENPY